MHVNKEYINIGFLFDTVSFIIGTLTQDNMSRKLLDFSELSASVSK